MGGVSAVEEESVFFKIWALFSVNQSTKTDKCLSVLAVRLDLLMLRKDKCELTDCFIFWPKVESLLVLVPDSDKCSKFKKGTGSEVLEGVLSASSMTTVRRPSLAVRLDRRDPLAVKVAGVFLRRNMLVSRSVLRAGAFATSSSSCNKVAVSLALSLRVVTLLKWCKLASSSGSLKTPN